jgi:hypothetical protein
VLTTSICTVIRYVKFPILSESWVVNPIKQASLRKGAPIYILYTSEEGKDGIRRGGFQGDIRIAKKVGTDKKDTLFQYKDGTTISIATLDVKTLVKVSNDIVNSGQVGTIFSKKFAHAEAIVDKLPGKESEVDDSESDDDADEDGEDTDSSVGEEQGDGSESDVGDDNIDSTGDGVEHEDGEEVEHEDGQDVEHEHGEEVELANGKSPTAANIVDTEGIDNLKGGTTATSNQNLSTTTDPTLPLSGSPIPFSDDTGSHASAPENPSTSNNPTFHQKLFNPCSPTTRPPSPEIEPAAAPPPGSQLFPLSNPMTTTSNVPPPPPGFEATDKDENVSDYMRAVREAQEKMRKAKKDFKRWKKAKLESSGKRALKKRLEEQLKVVKMEVKVKAAATKQVTQLPPQKRKRGDESESEDDDNGDDDFGFVPKKMKRVLTAVDKWQKGHRKAALAAASNKLVEKVTVTSWEGAYENMFEHGFAVVDDWTNLLSPECRPTQEQRYYILQRKYLGLFSCCDPYAMLII